jgi:hypothetical protein
MLSPRNTRISPAGVPVSPRAGPRAAPFLDQAPHFRETLWMARHQHQQHLRAEPVQGIQQQALLAIPRAGRQENEFPREPAAQVPGNG